MLNAQKYKNSVAIDIPFGKLQEAIEWCTLNCGLWSFMTGGSHGYVFYFRRKSDLASFLLRFK